MNSKLKDLFHTSILTNNNCPSCEDIFFLPSSYEAKKYGLKAKTEIEEQLRSASLNIALSAYVLHATGATYSGTGVGNPFAVRPSLRLNLTSEIDGANVIGSHKVEISTVKNKHFVKIEDLAVPKEFDVKYFEDYDKEIGFQTLYLNPASKFKPAKFEILNFDTMKDDGHILAILDQPLTCLHFGDSNKYTESYVRQQLELLPDLMFEKALEMQAAAKEEQTNAEGFASLNAFLIEIEKQRCEDFAPKDDILEVVTEEVTKRLNKAYTERFNQCQTEEQIQELDDLADSYVETFKKIVETKRAQLEKNEKLQQAKITSQKRAEERNNKLKAILDGNREKE